MRLFRSWLDTELAALAATNRMRACPPLDGPRRTRPTTGAEPLVSFCSNDYLGLASHPALVAVLAAAGASHGVGASASRLVAGDLAPHRTLEAELAALTGRPAALVFPSGYQTNVGVLSSLAGPSDLIASDAANHASLIDGCRLSRAQIAVYHHGDPADARRALASAPSPRHRFLVTESLFSMDGDAAPLVDLARAAAEVDAILIVDEAHALGVLGPEGRGLCAAAGLEPDVLIGTLGKALGASGGFAAGDPSLRDYLVNRARTFVFTTALPPPIAATAAAAVALLRSPEGAARRERLHANCRHLARRLASLPHPGPTSPGPIFPIVLGSDTRALAAAQSLRARGFFVPAIRPPTVPEGTARLRVTLSADHQPEEIDALADALADLLAHPA